MQIAKAEGHLSHMKRDLTFLVKFNCLLFTFFTVSYRNFFPLFVCFDIFSVGETSGALALSLAFTAENTNNLPLALRTCEKN